MCGQSYDEPSGWDDLPPQPRPPAVPSTGVAGAQPSRPRVYRLSGDKPERVVASVALATLGEMLNDAEYDLEAAPRGRRDIATARVRVLREARNRVLAAETRFRAEAR